MSYIRLPDYAHVRERPKPLTNYMEQMKKYLSLRYPDQSDEQIEVFLKDLIRERYTVPTVEAVVHKQEGHSTHIAVPLDNYIVNTIKDNNLSASGSCYIPASKREAFLRRSIDDKVKARDAFKKLYLDFEAQGMKRESDYYNQNQANAKIFNNAIPGGMNIKQFILGSKAGFNAITSTGRISVKQGYSFIERCVMGNIYLPTIEDTITYILNHARVVPESFSELINNGVIYTPTVTEVGEYLFASIRNYLHPTNEDRVRIFSDILSGLSVVERSYVFYSGCLSNLLRFNETLMRSWIDSCFIRGKVDPSLYADIDIGEIKSFKDDVLSCILSTNYRRLGEHPEKPGRWNGVKDAAKYNPEGLKEFIYVCRHFTKQFESLLHILIPVLRIETTFNKLIFQQKMARQNVALSDTDSNIFSTQELVKWKIGKVDFSQEAYEMNALVTFIISQCLEHIFGRLASGMGVEGEDVTKLSMKNEFLFPIMIITTLGKHYLTIATMQEGSLLPNPRKEIKGVGFKSSAYPKLVKDGFEKFIIEFIDEIQKAEPIKAASVLSKVADMERAIHTSLTKRESVFLQTQSIKLKEDYADPSISQYFYYELWQAVFSQEYGEMTIPNKCFKIPLKGGKKLMKDPEFLAHLQKNYPGIYKRLMAFIAKNPKRDISAILIPPFKGQIQPFFLEVMDIRAHISQCMAGYYHLLDSLGIGTVDKRADSLVCDWYDPSSTQIT